jgi:DNA-binding MarR family transcriptional regulator
VITEITIIDQLMTNQLERLLPPGLSMAQFGVLNHLVRLGPGGGAGAARAAFQVTKGAMTNTLQRLEAQGFVEVAGHPDDGRRKRVTLTPAGATAHQAAVASLDPLRLAVRAAFPPEAFEAALPFFGQPARLARREPLVGPRGVLARTARASGRCPQAFPGRQVRRPAVGRAGEDARGPC